MLLCNLGGALFGQWLVYKLGWEQRDHLRGGWEVEPGRMLLIVHLVTMRIIQFMNCFAFKWIVWLPSSHWLNVLHMIAYLFLFDPALSRHWDLRMGRLPVSGQFTNIWLHLLLLADQYFVQ